MPRAPQGRNRQVTAPARRASLGRMRTYHLALIAALLMPAAATADRPAAGLLTKESPLPATMPLQVIAPEGRDVVLRLTTPDAGDPVISGYVRGGTFFRLLVPPGRFTVTLEYGRDWQGPQDGFAEDPGRITLAEPLDFGITRGTRRNGHQIRLDLQDDHLVVREVDDQTICDEAIFGRDIKEYPEPGSLGDIRTLPPDRPRLRYLDLTYDRYARLCD